MIEDIKNFGKNNNIPITLDDTMKFITDYIDEFKIKTILEIGTAIAFGSINMASRKSVETIDSVEINADRFKIAQENVEKSNVKEKISLHLIDAMQYIKSCDKKFDLIYLDGPKGQYINYYPILLSLLNDGGVIIADNIYFHGMVLGKTPTPHSLNSMIRKLREFYNLILNDKKVNAKIYDIGDGVALIKKVDYKN